MFSIIPNYQGTLIAGVRSSLFDRQLQNSFGDLHSSVTEMMTKQIAKPTKDLIRDWTGNITWRSMGGSLFHYDHDYSSSSNCPVTIDMF